MKSLIKKEVIPRLRALFQTPYIIHQTLLVMGISQSILVEKIAD
ncbi:MAG: hypothetical protein ABI045_01520 [Flavobacteriales bacterium]